MPNEISDADYLAFIEAKNQGKFDTLEPGTFVAFFNGIWIATADSFEKITSMDATWNLDGDAYIDQVGRATPQRSINRGPRRSGRT